MKILFVYGAFENLGIEYLSAVLKLHGHSARLAFDPHLFSDPFINIKYLNKIFDYEKYLIKEIVDYQPDIVAFSVVSSEYAWSLKIAQEIKRRLPLTHITFGGIHPSSVPEVVLENRFIDSVIIGEGEFPLLDLADSLERKRVDYAIKNIWFRCDNSIVKNEIRPYIENLDSLPFPDKELYYEVMPQHKNGYMIITRRGCINSCSYCHNTIWQWRYPGQEKMRFRSVDNVIRELKEARKRYRFKRLRINDDLFTYNEDWLRDFSRGYKRYLDIPTYCFGSPSTINEDAIRYLKDISCYQLCLGVQSTSLTLRENVLNRQEDNGQIEKAIYLCRKHGIRCVVDNIIGLPGEKEEDIAEMARFYNKHRPDRICIFWLVYYPMTPIVTTALEEKILDERSIDCIERKCYNTANTLRNKIHLKNKIQYYWLLFILQFLPFSINQFIINRKLFRFFSRVNPAFFEAVYTIFAKDRLDIIRQRYYSRYYYFIQKIIYSKILGLSLKKEIACRF